MSIERAINRVADGLFAIAGALASAPESEELRPLAFVIGPVSEQAHAPALTPQFQGSAKGAIMATLNLTATQNCNLSVAITDKKGNPAPVEGVPEWAVDNSELLSIEPAADGLSAVISAVGPLGTALVSLQADADLGEGVTPLAGTLEVVVGAGAATVVEIVPGTPEEQP